MRLLDYFRILKALIILFLLLFCMNYVPNQNGKVLEEKLASFNSDDVNKSMETRALFQNDPPSFAGYTSS